ncbi:hypothetical protein BMF94_2901 [Rhodotorula taiwanensis]|uniref:Mediator of RNA polymerase II transcription subunit 10 n=1 Tax=Rhodotorula taiwanensis TaxID=741276 RepID=A0A2S5BBD3_9BASI|nr:hypothetical protein BMF94_2901 [Rhodotorula taiwanensis]
MTGPAPAAPAGPMPSNEAVAPRQQVEQTLELLLQTLLEMGICASDVQESALEGAEGGVAYGQPAGLLGRKALSREHSRTSNTRVLTAASSPCSFCSPSISQQTVDQLARLYAQKDSVNEINIPIEVINLVDQGKNPHLHTKNFVERLAGENMYTNGILSGISDYRDLLRAQLGDAFPELAEDVKLMSPAQAGDPPASTTAAEPSMPNGQAKMEVTH